MIRIALALVIIGLAISISDKLNINPALLLCLMGAAFLLGISFSDKANPK